jgi:hypothetical protein
MPAVSRPRPTAHHRDTWSPQVRAQRSCQGKKALTWMSSAASAKFRLLWPPSSEILIWSSSAMHLPVSLSGGTFVRIREGFEASSFFFRKRRNLLFTEGEQFRLLWPPSSEILIWSSSANPRTRQVSLSGRSPTDARKASKHQVFSEKGESLLFYE